MALASSHSCRGGAATTITVCHLLDVRATGLLDWWTLSKGYPSPSDTHTCGCVGRVIDHSVSWSPEVQSHWPEGTRGEQSKKHLYAHFCTSTNRYRANACVSKEMGVNSDEQVRFIGPGVESVASISHEEIRNVPYPIC